jgi:RIO-like serine/threonine protein kinase
MQLKSDLFGTVTRFERRIDPDVVRYVERDVRRARWWLRPLAYRLARREARALQALRAVPGVPQFQEFSAGVLRRDWIEGIPMHVAQPCDPGFFRDAFHLLRRVHRADVAHDDLAKEPNWLVTPEGRAALVDFQLAFVSRRRGRLFRTLAREDIRHLLKHKRTYCPQYLTRRELQILATPSLLSRAWMASGKKLYNFITRRIFGWADREGAGDRSWQ